MITLNFDNEMQKIVDKIGDARPKLLMHSCCAPCSTACIERVKDFFDLAIYYYNPNMDTEAEFALRANEQKRLCDSLQVEFINEEYNKQEFLCAIKGLESEMEGGKRCLKCFYLRLNKTAEKARELGYEYFTTTLTVSPLKNAKIINEIGQEIEKQTGVKFLPCDFKKRGGYLRTIELSKQFKLYRQNYCGCEFSKTKEREE